ncbi:MAG TPA: phosphate signaling complex protein PhoU [Rugosimonospora sp.]|nr:phosphate signaling complex protein PhoU [Rugosimonospora sp.]
MREEYRSELAEVSRLLVDMADTARSAMARATRALLTADATEAEEVLRGDDEIDALYRRVEERVYDLLARQAPVASDLRLVVTALHVAADIERMGDLADHVAKTALRRAPEHALPEELRPVITDLAAACDRLADKIARALENADAESARELEADDDAVDDLHKQLLGLMLGTAWRHGVEPAIDGALLGRFYERFADHAVNAGEQVVYLVTGEVASA